MFLSISKKIGDLTFGITYVPSIMKILLGYFNAKLGREDTVKFTTRNDSLHQDSNDNGVRKVNFDTSTNLVVKSTMFLHGNMY